MGFISIVIQVITVSSFADLKRCGWGNYAVASKYLRLEVDNFFSLEYSERGEIN